MTVRLQMNETQPVRPERHQGLDALRGLLMVTVIIGHFPTSGGGRNPFGPVPEWLYFFHIPLFLALSCLFSKALTPALLGQRARQILLPYGLWLAINNPDQLLRHPGALLLDGAMGNYAHVPSILWFLPALFSTNLLVGLSRRLRPRLLHPFLALLAAGGLALAPRLARCHTQIPFGLDVALYLLPFIWAMDQVWQQREALARHVGKVLMPAALLALPLGGTLIRCCEQVKTHSAYARRVDFAQFSVPETLPGYLGMALMAAGLLVLASRLPAPRWLAAVGRCSMPIFLLHYGLLVAFSHGIGLAGEHRGWLLAYGLTVTALIVALAMLFAWGLTRLSPRLTRLAGLYTPAPLPVSSNW